MKMMTNSSVAINISRVPFEEINSGITAALRTCSILAMCLNILIIACFSVKHNAIPEIYRTQTICLAINDTMAGVSSLMITFSDTDVFAKSWLLCFGTMSFFISSQVAILYSISLICIKRLTRFRKVGEMQLQYRSSTRNDVVCTAIVTTASYVVCLLPFKIWAKADTFYAQQGCSMDIAFGENAKYATRIVLGTCIVPFLGTNMLYVCMTVYLYRANKLPRLGQSVFDQRNHNTRRSSITASRAWKPIWLIATDGACGKPIIATRSLRLTDLRRHADQSPELVISNQRIINKRQLEEPYPQPLAAYMKKLSVEMHLSVIPEESIIDSHESGMPSTSEKSTDLDGNCNKKRASGGERTRLSVREQRNANIADQTRPVLSRNIRRRIRNAYVLLGLILLSLNLFTLPGIAIMLDNSNIIDLNIGRSGKAPLVSVMAWNAIVNPFLYTIRIKQFRKILLDEIRSVVKWFQCLSQSRQ